jgi:iron only hydrogenase large subunit-like protein
VNDIHEDIGISDIDLIGISTKELNRILKKKKIDPERQKELKMRRRTLKNRLDFWSPAK